MTLDGTRTYVIGRERAAIIDPGPLHAEHLDAVADAVGSGVSASVLLTHSHPDHADGAAKLATMLGTSVRSLQHQDIIETDAGELHALATPGHTPDHFSFWWPAEQAVFCGDLMMGGMDTALVARPEGSLTDYIASLQLLQRLKPRIIYPAHGEPFDHPDEAIARYIRHREERVAQVVDGLKERGPLSPDALLDHVYGRNLDVRLRHYAETAIEAYLAFLRDKAMAREAEDGTWSLT